MDKLQRAANTMWTSPPLVEDRELHTRVSFLDNTRQLREDGFTVLKGIFEAETVRSARRQILDHLALFKNTRPTPSSRHLAGFHRFPQLESLHTLLTGDETVQRFLGAVLQGQVVRSIGLSDITVNRSQRWHKDLLRGRFRSYLDEALSWDESSGGVFKVLFYLQAGASLKIVKGSHLQPISLEDDIHSEPRDLSTVATVAVEEGDIVVMDIRASHRGSDESAFDNGRFDDDPRMLISTAFGGADCSLTRAMEVGNFHRLIDWMERNP